MAKTTKQKKSYWYGGIFQNSEQEIYAIFAEKRKRIKKYEKKDTLLVTAKGENIYKVIKKLKKECQRKKIPLPKSCC